MSERSTWVERLQNQANEATCQKPRCAWPATGSPVQIFSAATRGRSPRPRRPISGRARTESAAAMKMRNIQGTHTLANFAITSKPKIASAVTSPPETRTSATQLGFEG